ncbi:hypothetical protein [Streptomyces sp. CBMA123]|uniref:hypothetical protein n=1 Tax=Streptomyces sp. CBMA123 TaxID=1896313 RepID=UPI001661D42D|nr:hypothetical protein [Streptomyces sp. CBMA123]MBD0689540.1 hypothetical protein [Streptomyces sp. CBMA123]
MVDVAHFVPNPPDDPRPPRRRWAPWSAGVLGVALIAGSVLWVWRPWRSLEIPRSACWSALSEADLKPLAGAYGTVSEVAPRPRIQTPTSPQENEIRSNACQLSWHGDDGRQGRLLAVRVDPAWSGIDADRAQDTARDRRVTPLDGGPGAAWLATADGSHRVRLYVRCDFQVPAATDPKHRTAPPYFRVDVGSDGVVAAPSEQGSRAYGDIALKIARAAAAEYRCTNQVQLPTTAPAMPGLVGEKQEKGKAHG